MFSVLFTVLCVTYAAVTPLTSIKLSGGYGPCDEGVKQYSGYAEVLGIVPKNYFFWMFESRNDPLTDPVILWMTGGPGCSSMLALLAENGPCHIDGSGNLYSNPFSWNNNASVIYIDQPAGVGFSYTTNASGYDHNETQVANDMYGFLQALYRQLPQFQSNSLFIFGESYGGHYAPATAHRVWVGNQRQEGITIKLAGVALGNGLTQPQIQYLFYGELAYKWCKRVKGSPCISLSQYNEMLAELPTCLRAVQQCNNNNTGCSVAQNVCNSQLVPYFTTGLNPYDIRIPCALPVLCYNFTNIRIFLNKPSVQASLGVDIPWASCNFSVDGEFADDVMRNFDTLLPDLLGAGVRVLVYAGDMDFICNWIGNKMWTMRMSWPQQQEFQTAQDKPWYVDEVEAGIVRYVSSNSSNLLFTFAQVHGAGHMVPMDQPKRSWDLVKHFLFDNIFM